MGNPEYWELFKNILNKKNENIENKQIDDDTFNNYKKYYSDYSYFNITPTQSLKISDKQILDFYYELLINYTNENKTTIVKSPVENNTDSSWMLEEDFCFLNVRALGKDKNWSGNLIDALKVLPTLRASSIHLAPFFECTFDNIYALDTLTTIHRPIVHGNYVKEGLDAYKQMKLLIDAAHLLNKTIGFDLEPHVSQFSRIVCDNPHLFRWIELDDNKENLKDNILFHDIILEPKQNEIIDKVKKIRDNIYKTNNISKLEDYTIDANKLSDIHQELIKELIKNGLWTIPSHTWGGAGLPEYSHYNKNGNYPVFTYLNAKGEDHSSEAFGMLTPYKFYDRLPVNRIPSHDEKPTINKEGQEFFFNIFPNLRKNFKFDFVRFDYVDHVFDGILDDIDDFPVSDRLTPQVIKDLTKNIKNDNPFIGFMAERMGDDIEKYMTVGFDLILGSDSLMDINKEYIDYHIIKKTKLRKMAQNTNDKVSILHAIDTHDTAHPLIWKKTPAERKGFDGMLKRYLFCRFANIGIPRRPKYECIGNQDLSYGLYKANNMLVNLTWKDDTRFNKTYHFLEDIYRDLKDHLSQAHIITNQVAERWCYWISYNANSDKKLIIIFMGLEPMLNYEKRELWDIHEIKNISIPLPVLIKNKLDDLKEINFETNTIEDASKYLNGEQLIVDQLNPPAVKMFFA